jgi:hypothetical protein
MNDLLKELENTYTAQFGEHFATSPSLFTLFSVTADGDQKRARSRLRASMRDGKYHFSTFRSGLYIGLSLSALASGIYESKHTSIREDQLST